MCVYVRRRRRLGHSTRELWGWSPDRDMGCFCSGTVGWKRAFAQELPPSFLHPTFPEQKHPTSRSGDHRHPVTVAANRCPDGGNSARPLGSSARDISKGRLRVGRRRPAPGRGRPAPGRRRPAPGRGRPAPGRGRPAPGRRRSVRCTGIACQRGQTVFTADCTTQGKSTVQRLDFNDLMYYRDIGGFGITMNHAL